MTLITDNPEDLASTNSLDDLPDDLLSIAPAYFSLGTTPQPMENPPNIGDVVTVIVRAKCTGTSDSVRTDGELRHGRKFDIQAAWFKGQPEPPDADADQPALYDDDGEPTAEAQGEGWDDAPGPGVAGEDE